MGTLLNNNICITLRIDKFENVRQFVYRKCQTYDFKNIAFFDISFFFENLTT